MMTLKLDFDLKIKYEWIKREPKNESVRLFLNDNFYGYATKANSDKFYTIWKKDNKGYRRIVGDISLKDTLNALKSMLLTGDYVTIESLVGVSKCRIYINFQLKGFLELVNDSVWSYWRIVHNPKFNYQKKNYYSVRDSVNYYSNLIESINEILNEYKYL